MTSSGASNSRARSSRRPTEIRNTPSNKPLNGSMVTSTWRRYSVSASSTPAISAPNAIDSPADAAASPVASTTSRQAAMNSSGLFVWATLRNSGAQDQPADHREQDDHGDGFGHRAEQAGQAASAASERAEQEEDRDDGEILEQEHGKAGAAGQARDAALVGQHLGDRRGRRHRECQAGDQRGIGGDVERAQGGRQRGSAQHDLQGAEAEDQAAQADDALPRHFEPDHEHQQHDAEFGHGLDAGVVGDGDQAERRPPLRERAQPGGPGEQADQHVADDRAEFEAVEQRYDDRGGAEDDERLADRRAHRDGVGEWWHGVSLYVSG